MNKAKAIRDREKEKEKRKDIKIWKRNIKELLYKIEEEIKDIEKKH